MEMDDPEKVDCTLCLVFFVVESDGPREKPFSKSGEVCIIPFASRSV